MRIWSSSQSSMARIVKFLFFIVGRKENYFSKLLSSLMLVLFRVFPHTKSEEGLPSKKLQRVPRPKRAATHSRSRLNKFGTASNFIFAQPVTFLRIVSPNVLRQVPAWRYPRQRKPMH